MTVAQKPEHANRDFPITGADPRITGRRFLRGYSYPQNGNVHNPTPDYTWLLLVDGNIADHFDRKRALVAAAREDGAAYLEGTLNYAALASGDAAVPVDAPQPLQVFTVCQWHNGDDDLEGSPVVAAYTTKQTAQQDLDRRGGHSFGHVTTLPILTALRSY